MFSIGDTNKINNNDSNLIEIMTNSYGIDTNETGVLNLSNLNNELNKNLSDSNNSDKSQINFKDKYFDSVNLKNVISDSYSINESKNIVNSSVNFLNYDNINSNWNKDKNRKRNKWRKNKLIGKGTNKDIINSNERNRIIKGHKT